MDPRYYTILLASALFTLVIGPHNYQRSSSSKGNEASSSISEPLLSHNTMEKEFPIIYMGYIEEEQYKTCVATIVDLRESIQKAVIAITVGLCVNRVKYMDHPMAFFQSGGSFSLSEGKEWNGNTFAAGSPLQSLDLGDPDVTAMGLVVMIGEEYKNTNPFPLPNVAGDHKPMRVVGALVADWNLKYGLTVTEVTILPGKVCLGQRNDGKSENVLLAEDNFCVKTKEDTKFSYGAPCYMKSGNGYSFLGMHSARGLIPNHNLFVSVRQNRNIRPAVEQAIQKAIG